MSEQLTIEQRVAAGVRYLDTYVPAWVEEITLPDLDMRSDCSCVIGQVVGTYDSILVDGWDHPKGIRLVTAEEAAVLGFDSLARATNFDARDSYEDRYAEEFEALQAEWERVITARRETAADLEARSGAVIDA